MTSAGRYPYEHVLQLLVLQTCSPAQQVEAQAAMLTVFNDFNTISVTSSLHQAAVWAALYCCIDAPSKKLAPVLKH